MTKALAVVFTRRAECQAERIDAWWTANRKAAPLLFKRELTQMLEMIAAAPTIGTLAKSARLAIVRRVLTPRTKYHVYYRADEHTLVVLAIWHAKRIPPRV